MPALKGTKTAGNLMKAFAGESQARNRYTFYSSVAKNEGLNQIASIFIETADNEKEHAKLFFEYLVKNMDNGVMQEVQADYPVAFSQKTLDNLQSAAGGEHEECVTLYPAFAKTADEEGFPEIARTFRNISLVEARHEARYNKLADNLKSGKVYKREEKELWVCMNCGYILESKEAPQKCPVCAHPQSYFQLFKENY